MDTYVANSHQSHFLNEKTKNEIDRYIQITCAYLNLFDFTNVLDVGGSDGKMSEFLKGNYKGIDINPMSDKVSRGTVFDVKEKYNLVVLNHVLEHMPDTQKVLSKLFDICEDNGLLFINVPIGQWAYEIKSHIILFNEEILIRNLKNAGFDIVEVSTHCFRENKIELWVMAKKGGWLK